LASVRLKGILNKWVDDRGFGFITPEKNDKSLFVHISAFDKAISRRPKVGDTIFYHVYTDGNGKFKAVDAIIQGVVIRKKTYSSPPIKRYRERRFKNSWGIFVLCIALLVGILGFFYNRMQHSSTQISLDSQLSTFSENSQNIRQPSSNYSCEGKTHCSQMVSCEEAQFYISNCPGTKMDGDGDGIPCERQWCN